MKLVISVPERLNEIPTYWPPQMPVDLSILESEGQEVTLFDNFIFRYPLDVVKKEYEGLHERPSDIFLWVTLRAYPNMCEYLKVFPTAKVVDFSLPDILDIKQSVELKQYPMPLPALHLLPLKVYWANCKLAFTPDTLAVEKFAVLDFKYGEKLVTAKRAAEIIHYIRLKYCPEFFIFETDFTQNREWTLGFIKRLEDFELSRLFNFSVKGSVHKVDWNLLKTLNESGCSVMDFGRVDVTELASHAYQTRLPAAVEACKMAGVTPRIEVTVGLPNTSIIDILEATKLLKAYGLLVRPTGIGIEQFSALMDTVEDKGKLLYDLALNRANFTGWNDATFYGLMSLMEMGDLEKIKSVT